MKKIICIIYTCFAAHILNAQEIFVAKGKIEYEKKVNMYKTLESSIEDGDDSWINTLKKTMPQYRTTYFDLYFDSSKTLYKPGREIVEAQKTPDWFVGPANDNVVYSDLSTQQSIAQKTVFENTFLIADSIHPIKWRITPDTRTIAGFKCRKAVGIIMDSVYVIAFYTQQIVTPGGPESFKGLPGMVLGVAIPRINTTWFATKLPAKV